MVDVQAEVIDFLSKSGTYGPGAAVERCETHGAIVFLVGARAYKLKRAVKLPYLDYSTIERRRAMCQAEVSINRPLAPMIYLGICPVVRNGDGTLCIGSLDEQDHAVDWLVVMNRFAQSALFSALCDRGALTDPVMRKTAEQIALFHQKALKTPSHGGLAGISAVVEECIAIFRDSPCIFPEGSVGRFDLLMRQALAQNGELLEARRIDGHVRRCHGDLHLNNICLLDGVPVLFDAIEFGDEFSCIDLLYDLAFLIMDLDQHGREREANILLNRYLVKTGDYAGLAALPLFLACRAAIRAHVAATTALIAETKVSPEKSGRAAQLLELSVDYLKTRSAQLVAIGGLSGTGKSTLAANLAPELGRRPGAIVIRTDQLRKELWGIPEERRLPQEAYSKESSARVYAALTERIGTILKTGQSVIADGVFGTQAERDLVQQLAERLSLSFHGLWLEGSLPVLEKRIEGRINDASDATVAVLHSQIRNVVPPTNWAQVSVTGPLSEAISKARQLLSD